MVQDTLTNLGTDTNLMQLLCLGEVVEEATREFPLPSRARLCTPAELHASVLMVQDLDGADRR